MLQYLSSKYVTGQDDVLVIELLQDFSIDLTNNPKASAILTATKERGKTLVELADQIRLITEAPTEYDEKASKKAFKGEAAEILTDFAAMLREANPQTQEEYHDVMQAIVAKREIGFGKIGMPLRVALLGSMTGAGMDEVMAILGVEETVKRIERAVETIAT